MAEEAAGRPERGGSGESFAAAAGTELFLIRHGETQWNHDQRIQGHLDVPLNNRGEEQARRLAACLAHEGIHRVYSSDLQRSLVTAEIVARGLVPVRIEPRVREARFGAWEGLTTREIQAGFPDAYRAWRADAIRNRPTGGETLEELRERCAAAVRDLLPAGEPEKIAIVAHGGPVRVMVCALLNLPLSFYPRIRVENTSVARILFTERGTILAGLNDVGHLRAEAWMPEHSGWEEK